MRFQGTATYIASDELKTAVNASITLERPLLIKGEPGTGSDRDNRRERIPNQTPEALTQRGFLGQLFVVGRIVVDLAGVDAGV